MGLSSSGESSTVMPMMFREEVKVIPCVWLSPAGALLMPGLWLYIFLTTIHLIPPTTVCDWFYSTFYIVVDESTEPQGGRVVCFKSYDGKVKELEFTLRSYFCKVHVSFFYSIITNSWERLNSSSTTGSFFFSWHQLDTLYLKIELDGTALISSTAQCFAVICVSTEACLMLFPNQ